MEMSLYMSGIYNCFGKPVRADDLELIDSSYGYRREDGKIVVFWSEESDDVDENGFDKKQIVDEFGNYCKEIVLPKGTLICRYGAEQGRTTTRLGEDYEKLALPYKVETIQYHEYEVIADGLTVQCKVVSGYAAKMFNSPGGAVQYLHSQRIKQEITSGKIKEVYQWMRKEKKYV